MARQSDQLGEILGEKPGIEAELAPVPLELQMDLLVDGELSEGQRAVLLRALELPAPNAGTVRAEWRQLALRFLQGQTEKETVRQLMAGGALIPVDFSGINPQRRVRFTAPRWRTAQAAWLTAAGLLVATLSAVATLYLTRATALQNPAHAAVAGAGGTVYFTGNMPGEAIGYAKSIPVSVPLLRNDANIPLTVFPFASDSRSAADAPGWRSVVIQKDASGNAVVIPINASQVKVY